MFEFIITIIIIITIYMISFKKNKTYAEIKKEELEKNKAKLKKYFDTPKQIENNETLHVNNTIKNIEEDWIFNQSKTWRQKPTYQENKKRGDDYEKQVGNHYEKLNYHVQYRGLTHGRKDDGIDLIAIKENETLLIQCKAWTNAVIKQKHVKEFIGNCAIFLEDNPPKTPIVKRIFITSSEAEDNALSKYLIQHRDKIQFIIMPFQK